MSEQTYYQMTAKEVLELTGSRMEGLSHEKVKAHRQTYGDNQIITASGPSLLTLFFDQFRNFMVIVLLIATFFSGLLGEYTDAITILVLVMVNALLGFWQQVRAEKALFALRKLAAPFAQVVRDGVYQQIPAYDVVRGDVIALKAGDRVPADARLLEVHDLFLEESSLTGESEAVVKSTPPLSGTGISLGDQRNMVFMSTLVTRGVALAVVIATGMQTELGKIAHLIDQHEPNPTPLEKRLQELGQVLVYLSIAVTLLVVLAGIWHGQTMTTMLLAGVSLAVAAIPEGLPAIVTIALALGVSRMSQKKAIIRKLPSVETLGCATVICSDKTGTLTKNQMTVTQIYANQTVFPLEHDERQETVNNMALQRLIVMSQHCHHAHWSMQDGKKTAQGDPTEIALLTMGDTFITKPMNVSLCEELPFDATRKRMSMYMKTEKGHEVWVKGAPEILLSLCTKQLVKGTIQPLLDKDRQLYQNEIEKMAKKALRTLCFAYKSTDQYKQDPTYDEVDLIFVGFVGMIDPPREEVKDAIAACRTAGIKTVMITGDHPLTAQAIAQSLSLLTEEGKLVTGAQLDKMHDQELLRQIDTIDIFARVTPMHKLRIVKAYQKLGHVVAMTGDGINDAPAIKAADIGIAMGMSGTDVAKEASDLVLADDQFTTIVAAIEEGRGIYDNIRKFIRYLLSCNIGEIVTMFLAMVWGLPLPLLPIQILWVNLVTDGLPAIALGIDGKEDDLMKKPPRHANESLFAGGLNRKIIGRGTMIGLITLGVFYGSLHLHEPLMKAQTMAFSTLVIAQLIHVFECRSLSHGLFSRSFFENKWLVAAVLSSLSLLLLVIYVPFLRTIFHTAILSWFDWLVLVLMAIIPSLSGKNRKEQPKQSRPLPKPFLQR